MNQLRRSPGTRREFSYFVEIPRNTKPVGSDAQLTKVLLPAATPALETADTNV